MCQQFWISFRKFPFYPRKIGDKIQIVDFINFLIGAKSFLLDPKFPLRLSAMFLAVGVQSSELLGGMYKSFSNKVTTNSLCSASWVWTEYARMAYIYVLSLFCL